MRADSPPVTAATAIVVLNRAARADARAMTDLISQRVACNDALAADPSIQVGRLSPAEPMLVGIAAHYDADGQLDRFELTDR